MKGNGQFVTDLQGHLQDGDLRTGTFHKRGLPPVIPPVM